MSDHELYKDLFLLSGIMTRRLRRGGEQSVSTIVKNVPCCSRPLHDDDDDAYLVVVVLCMMVMMMVMVMISTVTII